MSAPQPPVFVDDTGRRRILTRRTGRIVVIAFTGYLGLVGLGLARDPRVGPVHLPTFGLPSLGLMLPPAPSVPEAQATQTAATAPTVQLESPTTRATTAPPSGQPTAAAPAGSPTAGRATTPTTGLPASNTSTTTSPSTSPSTSTSTSTSTTSSTTTTTTSSVPGQGQGQAQRAEAASTKGPDGSGPPGQVRKTTPTTVG